MTKSTITRERIQRIIRAIDSEAYDEEEIREWLSSDEIMELTRIALAAMDSEPVGTLSVRHMSYSGKKIGNQFGFVHSDAAMTIAEGDYPLYRHAQPPVAHIPVLYKGAELLSRSGLELIRDGASFATDLESACMAEALLAAAQPAPAVPEEWTIADAVKFCKETGRQEAGAAMDAWNACRAAMLHAGNSPVIPDGYVMVPKVATEKMLIAGLEEADPLGSLIDWNASLGDCNTREQVQGIFEAMLAAAPQSPGSEPATVPGKWIPVSEEMPEREVDVQVYCPDKKEQMVAYLERNELEGYFRFATWRTGDGIYCQPTHWMQLPAGPQEVPDGK